MLVSYDVFTAAFLSKITEYSFVHLSDENRQQLTDGYLKLACSAFSDVCLWDLNGDDDERVFNFTKDDVDITPNELDEIVDIISEGMVYQWFKQYMYAAENLKNMLNTNDFSAYSPAELLYRMTNAYTTCERNFTNRVRAYSYRHGDLTNLHL